MKVMRLAGTFGALLKVFSFFLLIPALGSVYWDEAIPSETTVGDYTLPLKMTTLTFVLTFTIVLLAGFMLTSLAGPVSELRQAESLFVVGTSWLLCAAFGGIPFLVAGATRDPSIAFFESMSGITTTGFSALASPLEQYAPSIHMWRATLHGFGGMGLVVIAVAIVSNLTEGGARMISGETGGDVERLRPKLSQTARSIALIYLTLNAIGFLAFWATIHNAGLEWKEAGFEAYVHALGAFATGGFSSRTLSIEAFGSRPVTICALIFMFAGGISFPLYFAAFRRGIGTFFRSRQLRFYAGVVGMAFLGVALFLVVQGRDVFFIAENGMFLVVSTITTTGFTSTDPNGFPDGAKLILVFLMFTGAMVGSTAGGIKIARIELLLRLTALEIQKLLHPRAVSVARASGRTMPEETQRRVVVFFFAFVSTFIAGALAFSLLGADFTRSIVTSAASIGNVGYGWAGAGFANPEGPAARLVGIGLMWMGRLEIFTVLVLFFPRTYRE